MTGKSILIIDDQPEAAQTLRRTLVTWGHAVEIVADSSGGLAWYWEYRPSIVMVHTEMSGADTVIADIRASAPNTLIVAMADQAGIPRCMRMYKDSASSLSIDRFTALGAVDRVFPKYDDVQVHVKSFNVKFPCGFPEGSGRRWDHCRPASG